MPRMRAIKPSFFANELLAECQPLARVLFAGLWCWADREGRLEDRPRRIKAEILPYDDVDVDALLGELSEKGFILRYAYPGPGTTQARPGLIQVLAFTKHQRPHNRELPSEFPGPDPGTAQPDLGKAGPDLGDSQPDHFAQPRGNGDGNGEWGLENGEGDESAAEAASPSLPPDEVTRLLVEAQSVHAEVRACPYAPAEAKAERRDREAITACLAAAGGDEREFLDRWARALLHDGWPRVNTLHELRQHWGQFGLTPREADTERRARHQAAQRAEAEVWRKAQEVAS